MKKDYNLKIEDGALILENTTDPKEQFHINIEKLQFDTKAFYEAVFANVEEHIEITIGKDLSISELKDPNLQKVANHVYETIISIINQVCTKLNEECFDL